MFAPGTYFHGSQNNCFYKIIKPLGQGGSASVYLAQQTKNGQKMDVALKAIKKNFISEREIELTKYFSGKELNNINKIYELFQSDEYPNLYFISLQYCNHGNLLDQIELHQKENREIPYSQLLDICLQVATGIQQLHNKKIIHRDIKPENILIHQNENINNNKFTYYICDIGIAKRIEKTIRMTQQIGTPYYMAPELLEQNNQMYDSSVDIWAFGCVIYELVTLKTLFQGYTEKEVFNQIFQSQTPQKKAYLDKINNQFFRDLIEKMIRYDFTKRIFIDEVIDKLQKEIENQKQGKQIKKQEIKNVQKHGKIKIIEDDNNDIVQEDKIKEMNQSQIDMPKSKIKEDVSNKKNQKIRILDSTNLNAVQNNNNVGLIDFDEEEKKEKEETNQNKQRNQDDKSKITNQQEDVFLSCINNNDQQQQQWICKQQEQDNPINNNNQLACIEVHENEKQLPGNCNSYLFINILQDMEKQNFINILSEKLNQRGFKIQNIFKKCEVEVGLPQEYSRYIKNDFSQLIMKKIDSI